MKTRLALFLLVAALSAGCVSSLVDQHLPEGKADKVRYTRTGKFSSTTIEADRFEKTAAHVSAERLTFKHSNAWLPNVELTAEGYSRAVAPAQK